MLLPGPPHPLICVNSEARRAHLPSPYAFPKRLHALSSQPTCLVAIRVFSVQAGYMALWVTTDE
eukprot:3016312-Pleurochrysis_carterae.AAC.3